MIESGSASSRERSKHMHCACWTVVNRGRMNETISMDEQMIGSPTTGRKSMKVKLMKKRTMRSGSVRFSDAKALFPPDSV